MPDSPYPVSSVPKAQPPGEGRQAIFDTPDALSINQARLDHLASLNLPLEGRRVLDAGCGVGQLAPFFVDRGCAVVCIDARAENIAELRSRRPNLDARVVNIETEPLAPLGGFPIVFCYGLLYHLENPVAGLRNMAAVCEDLLLLETLVSDDADPVLRLLDEGAEHSNQTLGAFGCRPSPSFVAMSLNRVGFPFVYAPAWPPEHADFVIEWKNNGEYSRDGHNLRCVFVASRRPLNNSALVSLLTDELGSAPRGAAAARVTSATLPKRIWIDVGAHLGQKTFPVAEADASVHVYAFEPNLRLALRRAGELPNYTVIPMAVDEQSGVAEFYINAHDATSSLLPLNHDGLRKWIGGHELQVVETVLTPVIRLDRFMDLTGIEKVDYLKIDAQGADLQVVRSAGKRLPDIARITLEVQITPFEIYVGAAQKEDVIEYLARQGFVLEAVEKQSHDQEENLTFVFQPLLRQAQSLVYIRPLGPYPGWRFDADWDNPDLTFRMRRDIWSHFRQVGLDAPFVMKWYDDLEMMLYLGNDMSRQIFVGGCNEPNEFAFLGGILKPGMVFLDAGANDGLYTLFAAGRVAQSGIVWAFEPSAREFERLNRNVRLNHLTNVRTFRLALADREGTVALRVADSEHAGQNTLGDFVHQNIGLLHEETVEASTVDALVARERLNRLDVMKLDVEGSEGRLLEGARETLRSMRPVVMLECLEPALLLQQSSTAHLLDCFRSMDYMVYRYDEATGRAVPAGTRPLSDNIVAIPAERAPAE